MSSIVKKSSHFTPKVKKRTVRKESMATPPATQIQPDEPASQAAENTQNDTVSSADGPGQAQSPPATQEGGTEAISAKNTAKSGAEADQNDENTQNPLLSYTISDKPAAASSNIKETEPVVDPMQKVPEQAVGDNSSDSNEEYGDNDIFKQPLVGKQFPRRRSSVAGHRRLSGIHQNRRNSSISIPGTPAVPEGDLVTQPPVTIGVPSAKATKKRRSSVARPGRKSMRGSVIAIPDGTLKEEIESETGPERSAPNAQKSPTKAQNMAEYVIGIDPKTQKLKKYKTSQEVMGSFPVAPPDLITSITSAKQLPRRVKNEDEALFSLVGVSAETSMADLCKPLLQIGSKSENFASAEEARVRILKRKNERREARGRARSLRISYQKALRDVQGDDHIEIEEPKTQIFDDLERQAAPQHSGNLKLAVVEGQFQLDQESMIRSRGVAPNSDNRTVELENPFQNPVTASSYSKQVHTDQWTKEEMVELYRALSTWGTDFTLIAQLFPYRTRRQVKNKFTLEEKNNPELIELALRRKLPPNFEEFCASASALRLKSVDDFNREMAELQKDHESHLREITAERERAIKEDLEANRKREIEIRTGAKPMTKAERSRMIRQNEVVVGEIDDVKRSRDTLDH